MLAVCFLTTLFYLSGTCQHLKQSEDGKNEVIQCLIAILQNYFSEETELTFVQIATDDDELLKEIHSSLNYSIILRQASHQMLVPNQAYLIASDDVEKFIDHFDYLLMEATWNPSARFLIVMKMLHHYELKIIFDELLSHHVINVVVVNGTDDGQLYTYNPFDNYACGKYYDNITSFGLCSQTNNNLYPNKLITGLRKCNFTASLSHRPPYTMDPSKLDGKSLLGTEEYIITLLGDIEQFSVNFNYNYDSEDYSTVAPNMTVYGPMTMLQNGDFDIAFGAIRLVSSRVEAFSYLYGYLDYVDELRFVVKSSTIVPTWHYIYLEFELDVWAVLLASFVIYSIIVITLLRSKDKGKITLSLLSNLLLHGHKIRSRFSVRCILIIWVWFAYLINTFYQSNLFSLTTEPSMAFQISDEDDISYYNLKPCFGQGLRKYLVSETDHYDQNGIIYQFKDQGCENTNEALNTIIANGDMFTIVPSYVYLYDERKYNDKWGEPMIYFFEKPYAKFLYGYYFYKGFPITKSLLLNALRIRESGLAEKRLSDIYYSQKLKRKFSEKGFRTRFILPWRVYIPGSIISTLILNIEILFKFRFRR